LHIVAELHDLDLQAIALGHLLHLFEDLRVRAGGDADLERPILRAGGGPGQRDSGREGE
jgi:hypothetical protein